MDSVDIREFIADWENDDDVNVLDKEGLRLSVFSAHHLKATGVLGSYEKNYHRPPLLNSITGELCRIKMGEYK